jgi:hypothetical protein
VLLLRNSLSSVCCVRLSFASRFGFVCSLLVGINQERGVAVSDGEEEEEDVHGVVLLLRARV